MCSSTASACPFPRSRRWSARAAGRSRTATTGSTTARGSGATPGTRGRRATSRTTAPRLAAARVSRSAACCSARGTGRGSSLLFERNLPLPRDRAPLHELGLDELAELAGRHRHRVDRLAREPLLERGRRERLADLVIQLRGDLRRHLRRPDDPVPLYAVEAL